MHVRVIYAWPCAAHEAFRRDRVHARDALKHAPAPAAVATVEPAPTLDSEPAHHCRGRPAAAACPHGPWRAVR